jgi:hypothetical protein
MGHLEVQQNLFLLKFAVLEYSFDLIDMKQIANWFTL